VKITLVARDPKDGVGVITVLPCGCDPNPIVCGPNLERISLN